LPCSVCGADTLWREGWFVVVENRWLDRLRILSWHSSLASRQGFKSACGRQHLKVLIGYWLEQASLRLVPQAEEPMPITSNPGQNEAELSQADLTRVHGAHLVGELSVYREAFSREWTGSPSTLESIVDALLARDKAQRSVASAYPLFQPPHEPPYRLPLH